MYRKPEARENIQHGREPIQECSRRRRHENFRHALKVSEAPRSDRSSFFTTPPKKVWLYVLAFLMGIDINLAASASPRG